MEEVKRSSSAQAHFRVKYNGPVLEEGRMPVSDFAPALLGLGEMFNDVRRVAYPESPPVSLDIQATNEGSFEIDLLLLGPAVPWNQIIDLLDAKGTSALANLVTIVGGSFGLIKWLNGRSVVSEEPGQGEGAIKIATADGASIEVPVETANAVRSVRVREKAKKVVRPLSKNGITSMAIETDSETTVMINDGAVTAFEVPEIEPVAIHEQEYEVALMISAAVFTDGNKWKFSDGESTFHAAIEDESFLSLVDRGEPFRKGDSLLCRIRSTQSQTVSGLKTEKAILEVIRHIPSLEQLPLLGDG